MSLSNILKVFVGTILGVGLLIGYVILSQFLLTSLYNNLSSGSLESYRMAIVACCFIGLVGFPVISGIVYIETK